MRRGQDFKEAPVRLRTSGINTRCAEVFGCRGLGVKRLGAFFEATHKGSLAPENSLHIGPLLL